VQETLCWHIKCCLWDMVKDVVFVNEGFDCVINIQYPTTGLFTTSHFVVKLSWYFHHNQLQMHSWQEIVFESAIDVKTSAPWYVEFHWNFLWHMNSASQWSMIKLLFQVEINEYID
jgi:hypothetical protein